MSSLVKHVMHDGSLLLNVGLHGNSLCCYKFYLEFVICSAADWRYAAEQFVKNLPDKVIVHRKYLFALSHTTVYTIA